MGDNGKAA